MHRRTWKFNTSIETFNVTTAKICPLEVFPHHHRLRIYSAGEIGKNSAFAFGIANTTNNAAVR